MLSRSRAPACGRDLGIDALKRVRQMCFSSSRVWMPGVAGIPDLAPVTGLGRPALALASGIEIADGALPLTKSRGEDVPARI